MSDDLGYAIHMARLDDQRPFNLAAIRKCMKPYQDYYREKTMTREEMIAERDRLDRLIKEPRIVYVGRSGSVYDDPSPGVIPHYLLPVGDTQVYVYGSDLFKVYDDGSCVRVSTSQVETLPKEAKLVGSY